MAFKPLLSVDGNFLWCLTVFRKQVIDDVNEETARPARRVINRVTEIRSSHLHHESPDLAWGAELPVKCRLTEMGEEIFKDIALHVGPEFFELYCIQFINNLL